MKEYKGWTKTEIAHYKRKNGPRTREAFKAFRKYLREIGIDTTHLRIVAYSNRLSVLIGCKPLGWFYDKTGNFKAENGLVYDRTKGALIYPDGSTQQARNYPEALAIIMGYEE